jgi:rhodanese-related sulfurtransferase
MPQDIAVEDAARRLEQGALLLDVREVDEWEAGHAPEAQHLPLSTLAAAYESLPADREIVVVCKVGGRSAQAAAFLEIQGYNTTNLDGGMLAWEAAGRPVADSNGNSGAVI